MKIRHAVIINLIWTIIWTTLIYFFNGGFETDYQFWFLIIYVSVICIPYCFIDEGTIRKFIDEQNKREFDKEERIKEIRKK